MKCKIIAMGMLLVIIFASAAMAADDYKRHPGYVDFEKMGIFGEMDASVEIILKGSMLKLMRGIIEDEDPELADMIGKLLFIHVQAFPVDEVKLSSLEKKVKAASKQLEKKDWEIIVRVRDKREDEQVYIYVLPTKSDQIISGLVVMVIEEDEDAVFINVVGDVDPAQIGRIGDAFDIDDLEDLDWDEE
jgi:hypothetical protein